MRLELPEQMKLVHETVLPIRWGDLDAMGHVNNTVYFRYFEITRIEWFDAIGAPVNPNGEGPVIVNAFCNFLRQLEYPGSLVARHFTGGVGRSSIETFFTLERSDEPGVVCANGGAKVVWTDGRTRKSAPIPAWLRERLSS